MRKNRSAASSGRFSPWQFFEYPAAQLRPPAVKQILAAEKNDLPCLHLISLVTLRTTGLWILIWDGLANRVDRRKEAGTPSLLPALFVNRLEFSLSLGSPTAGSRFPLPAK